jgi:hypothetical protein
VCCCNRSSPQKATIFCELLDGPDAFLETLARLPPGLQDLHAGRLDTVSGYFYLPNDALQHLHNLTTLSLSSIELEDPD